VFLALALLGCGSTPEGPNWEPIEMTRPLAGAAESSLDIPLGTPLAGYTGRCRYVGGSSNQDDRESPYTTSFVESTGQQTRPRIKAIWLEAGGESTVILKADFIYSFDGIVSEITERLEAETGLDLYGKVVFATSHSHSSWGTFSGDQGFYLGGDRFNDEVFERTVATATDTALMAYADLEEVSIGVNWVRDWDLNDTVYKDRRDDNDELAFWDDVEPGYGKDPWLGVVRIDDSLGQPLAAMFHFGIHGTVLGQGSSMVSTDAPGHIELALEDHFTSDVVVMHLQGAGGDAAPTGGHSDYARLEGVGESASGLLLSAWEATPTSNAPIRLESASRHFPQSLEDISVTRGGAVDLYYKSYEQYYVADEEIYDADGKLLSPIDEFNAQYGATFCGAEIPMIPAASIGVEVFPYTACTDFSTLATVIEGFFDLEPGAIPLPLPSSEKAGVLATRIGPLITSGGDGEIVEQELIAGFFPGEPTSMFVEQWRRSVSSELGWEQAMLVGYSQDHEGYLLIPEDWMLGGYESNINIWGPLQAEYLLEETVSMIDSVLGNDLREPADPDGRWSPTVYPEVEVDVHTPDATVLAGTILNEPPDYLWLPLDLTPDLVTPSSVERGTGIIQIAWHGGDPAVDTPRVVLERLVDDEWTEALGPSGRPITDLTPAILVSHTPYPLEYGSPDRQHVWWASWQSVGGFVDRLGMDLGTYRLAVSGQYYESGDTGWPWQVAPYSLEGDEFELNPATISIAETSDGLELWMEGPENGWRLIDINGDHRGENGIFGDVTIEFEVDSTIFVETVETTVSGNKSHALIEIPGSATSVFVVDQYGNRGELSL